jgi:hypothetical protein
MIVDGRGAHGFVKATALVKLAADGNGTRVSYDTDAQVGGKIASVGQRLLEASARAVVNQSLEGLHTNIKLRAAAHRGIAAQAPRSEASPAPAVAAESIATAAASTGGGESPSAEPPARPAAPAASPVANADPSPPAAAASPGASESAQAPSVVAFTPVKVKQSAIANAVAKEVASTLFPRSVLVGIILIQAAVIVWLLVRH